MNSAAYLVRAATFGQLTKHIFDHGGGQVVVTTTRRAGTPSGRLHWSHGEATERTGDRESISPSWMITEMMWSRFRKEIVSGPIEATSAVIDDRFHSTP